MTCRLLICASQGFIAPCNLDVEWHRNNPRVSAFYAECCHLIDQWNSINHVRAAALSNWHVSDFLIALQLYLCDRYRALGPATSHPIYTAAINLDMLPQWMWELQFTFELADMHVADLHHKRNQLELDRSSLENIGCVLESALSALGRDIAQVPPFNS